MQIGYIGLGAMGGALARRLLLSHPLRVLDLDRGAVAAFEKQGAIASASPAELARSCDVIMMCLPRSANVRQAIFGENGLFDGLSAGKIVIDQTSGNPAETAAMAEQLSQHDVTMLDAPVSGGIGGAEAGTIAIMVSGPRATYDDARPALLSISPNVEYVSNRIGDAQALKLINNAMSAGCRLATLEAAALGRKLGLPLSTIAEVLNRGQGRNKASKVMLPALMEGKPSAGSFALSLMLKDLNLATGLGMKCDAPMPIANLVRALLQAGVNRLGDKALLEDTVRLIDTMSSTRIADA
ncbi:3-hydroxyisobutyrate dehydrogenase [Paraburkholderia sabiae]|uniref:NAD(P)-dependent oxidoreductase n=1 Tax=Paraburkholderia sabiae TaxID=273251 RepID=UPI001CB1CBCE|nr:NAD(P)-dependent oxidoreductase [Paraburkholderia sabiae]CAG9232759.1 3-hydroxyisobutyrate dehydrogenase [Paraburkholderia sabiae]